MNQSRLRWEAALLPGQQLHLFALWMIDSGLCSTEEDFQYHFGTDVPIGDVIHELMDAGFVEAAPQQLTLTPRGRAAVEQLKAPHTLPQEDLLAHSVASFRTTLATMSRDATPIAWAGIQDNLGVALSKLASRKATSSTVSPRGMDSGCHRRAYGCLGDLHARGEFDAMGNSAASSRLGVPCTRIIKYCITYSAVA